MFAQRATVGYLDSAPIPTELATLLLEGLAIGLAIYVYLGISLSMLARKTGTPGAGGAWIPILNLILMCRIARKPAAFAWWLLIPFINVIAFVAIWVAIARIRGKSPALAFLILLPPVSIAVPWIMASGPANHSSLPSAASAAPRPGVTTAICPACGRPECVTEEFCGYTGHRIRARAAGEISF